MSNFNPVVFRIGYGEFTLREIFFGLGILSLICLLGFVIYQKIDNWIEESNAKYLSAVWTTDDETFQNRLKTDSRDAFSFGKWFVVDPIGYEDWEKAAERELKIRPTGRYAEIQAVKEHYTRHTRTVTYTTYVNGRAVTRTRTEVYYTWDVVYSKTVTAKRVNFCGVEFSYDTIKPNEGFRCLPECYWHVLNDRWNVYVKGTEAEGIAFVTFDNGGIGHGNVIETKYRNTPEDFQKYLDKNLMGNGPRIAFWIILAIVSLAAFFLFCMADNWWLNG